MSTHLPRVVLATALSLPLFLSTSPFSAPAQAQTAERYADQARVVTNAKRADHGLVRLDRGRCVQRFAARQAERMARQQRVFHQDLDVVLRRCDLSAVGENVAYGYDTGRAGFSALMHSHSLGQNILNPRYRALGMAARRGPNGELYSAQVFGRH